MNWKLVFVFTLFTGCFALKVKVGNYGMEKQRIIASNETLIGVSTELSDIACAYGCLITSKCCSSSYGIDTKTCRLSACCNPETQPSENEIVIQTIGISTREEECIASSGFIYNGSADVCYYIGAEMDVNFTHINALCPLMDSKLIAVDSEVKQLFVQDILEYRFDDGSLKTYFNWDEYQPGSPNTDHYIILRKYTSYKWHDVPSERPDLQCTFICENNPRTGDGDNYPDDAATQGHEMWIIMSIRQLPKNWRWDDYPNDTATQEQEMGTIILMI
ncbi:unnamed protein product [Mytilus edulis]|uniref:Uncharacterized protein n=1 Tax=Mytilus edulis TaxID=6550 RepID=A0A8S3S4Z1_MYTED|nr:unnamed protein product [Mytilus edulis]